MIMLNANDLVVPLRWESGVLEVLDQRRIPQEEVWIRCQNSAEVIEAIKTLAVRGAPAIGIAGGLAVVQAIRQLGEGHPQLPKLVSDIRNARPTAVNLMNAVDKVWADGKQTAQQAEDVALGIWEQDLAASRSMAECGLRVFPAGDALTICHTGGLATGGLGTALSVLAAASRAGKLKNLYSLETRPLGQGLRLTIWECLKRRIPVKGITDNMAAIACSLGQIKSVWVGADRIAANGDTANKVGTLGIAIIAKHYGIPFFVVAPESTKDRNIRDGSLIPIEERAPSEILEPYGRNLGYPSGEVVVYNPAFDVTPATLITGGIVTEKGLWKVSNN